MKTLLIADDDPDLRLLLQTTLEDPAYRILEASDGESALQLVRQERPDVVILDRMMPKLNGLEVARAVLADPVIRHIPLILLTALEQPAAGDGEPAPKVFAYLVKPFSPLLARNRPAGARPNEHRLAPGRDETACHSNNCQTSSSPAKLGL